MLKDQYVEFLEAFFKFEKREFCEVFALDVDYQDTNWARRKVWVNPPWKLCQDAVDKLVKDCPAEFVMLGIKSKKPWTEALWTLRCEEVTLPKSVGNGFFVQLQSNSEYKPLPFPWWELVAFHGFAENIEKYKSELLPPVVVRSTTATAEHAVPQRAVRKDADRHAAGRGQAFGVTICGCFRRHLVGRAYCRCGV